MVWHLKPFSSRHCFSQTWQYHLQRESESESASPPGEERGRADLSF